MSLTFDYKREQKAKKKVLSSSDTVFIQNAIASELTSILEDAFKDANVKRVMLEVDPKVLSYFVEVLETRFAKIYAYEQVSECQFVFSPKVFRL